MAVLTYSPELLASAGQKRWPEVRSKRGDEIGISWETYMGCCNCVKVYWSDVLEEASLMQNASPDMSIEALSCRTKYEPNSVARNQTSQTVSGHGEPCNFFPVIFQTLHGGEGLRGVMRFNRPLCGIANTICSTPFPRATAKRESRAGSMDSPPSRP